MALEWIPLKDEQRIKLNASHRFAPESPLSVIVVRTPHISLLVEVVFLLSSRKFVGRPPDLAALVLAPVTCQVNRS